MPFLCYTPPWFLYRVFLVPWLQIRCSLNFTCTHLEEAINQVYEPCPSPCIEKGKIIMQNFKQNVIYVDIFGFAKRLRLWFFFQIQWVPVSWNYLNHSKLLIFQQHLCSVDPQGHCAIGRILCQRKITMTPAGIEPATFRFVAQHINHCATLPRSPSALLM